MNKVDFSTSIYYPNPVTTDERVSNFIEESLYIHGQRAFVIDPETDLVELRPYDCPMWITVLKIIAMPLTLFIFPVVLLLLKTGLRSSHDYHYVVRPPIVGGIPNPILDPQQIAATVAAVEPTRTALEVALSAPKFKKYLIGFDTQPNGVKLTGMSSRPANLFFDKLLGKGSVTQPGSGELFRFNGDPREIRAEIDTTEGNIEFTAKGERGHVYINEVKSPEIDLSMIYGDATYRISYAELKKTLDSQKVFVAAPLPASFYSDLKQALLDDGYTDVLPGSHEKAVKLKEINGIHCERLLEQPYTTLGFKSQAHMDSIVELDLYQLGSLVVKTEDYRIFMDSHGKIMERVANQNDAIRLINACGIRPTRVPTQNDPKALPKATIMTEGFRASLVAAESGYVVFPAVGMGVWGGSPDFYWRAFLNAVMDSPDALEQIFINPRHRPTPRGVAYAGRAGDEFAEILAEFKAANQNDPARLERLNKIVNLHDQETDVVHLSYELKKAFPDKIISLFNASDPDVTLGNHVGEYVNNLEHADTTEENYTAMGSNGLCFESITGVDRVTQIQSK